MAETGKWYLKRYLQEVIFFIAMFLLTMLHEWMKIDTVIDFIKGLVFFVLLYGQAQFHRFFIFPLLLARRYLLYTLAAIAAILAGATLSQTLNYFWIDPAFYRSGQIPLWYDFIYQVVLCVISTFTILSLFLVRRYSRELQQRNEAQLMLSEMNIRYLHAQLNPHFFFNMFHNLYGVSLTDPARTPDLILKLSALMRYQLEQASQSTVSLKEELDFIGNYIAMENERIGNRCAISYVQPPAGPSLSSYRIAPLVLITFVENAFKHSITTSRAWFVHIILTVEDDVLTMDVHNSLPDETFKPGSTGIGLVNTRQRLELLYPGRYQLLITKKDGDYRTRLVLHLNIA
ncbi:sensor histidine kinase [Taibaiella chishuiensis]|nr:histidine kinase [Taibaiella chishuiensis]